ncbi:hypothetical protein P691DRAFT_324547 [Macrolepiota fuliginosa MF-IS2]|uniref:5'-3' exoribonuclease 1 SH3-like domain-containing protein n=1 Tax=Macrolepiota fuliginosa MF-IS2 TaxID=1400762 RepID=A0A9P6C0J9_9AGAR|nr:hypothetical protein P691DRAFT_324547 [Macrolepiota fuliginosa MF-IS2]
MVRDSGAVPLSVKGVVIGLNAKSMDVLWDVPFMSGVTLGDRCSAYRGMTVDFNSCLNLSNPQFVTSTNPKAPPPPPITTPFNPRYGPHPVIQPAPGQRAAAGFRPAPPQRYRYLALRSKHVLIYDRSQSTPLAPVQIISNPNRTRGGYVNGRGGHPSMSQVVANGHGRGGSSSGSTNHVNGRGGPPNHQMNGRGASSSYAPSDSTVESTPTSSGTGFSRGGPRGRGYGPARGRGFVSPVNGFVSRGAPRGGMRGRGRGSFSPVVLTRD